jgi:hypothetical protein
MNFKADVAVLHDLTVLDNSLDFVDENVTNTHCLQAMVSLNLFVAQAW